MSARCARALQDNFTGGATGGGAGRNVLHFVTNGGGFEAQKMSIYMQVLASRCAARRRGELSALLRF